MEQSIAVLLVISEVSCVDVSVPILVGAFSVHLFIQKVASVNVPIRKRKRPETIANIRFIFAFESSSICYTVSQ